VQGAKDNKDNSAAAGRETHSVSLELSPEQVKKIAIAKELGKLSLAVRSAVEQRDQGDAGAMSGCDVSPEIAGQNAIASGSATVVVYAGDKAKEFSVPKHDAGAFGCDPTRKVAERGAGFANLNSDAGKN
jgi:pilus assembly protein CpaB